MHGGHERVHAIGHGSQGGSGWLADAAPPARPINLSAQALATVPVSGGRKRFRARLDLIAARYPPRLEVDLDDLADMLSAVADGGIILSKVLKEKDALPRQIMLYRGYVRAVFLGA